MKCPQDVHPHSLKANDGCWELGGGRCEEWLLLGLEFLVRLRQKF